MPSVGPLGPGTAATDGTVIDVNNALTLDDVGTGTIYSASTGSLILKNFGFSGIPLGATINSVDVALRAGATPDGFQDDVTIFITTDGTTISGTGAVDSAYSYAALPSFSTRIITLSGVSALGFLSASDVMASTFGIFVGATNADVGYDLQVDYATLTVNYTLGSGVLQRTLRGVG